MAPARNRLQAAMILATACLGAGAARGHSVSLSTGTLSIGADRLILTLTIPGDDLLHVYRPTPDAEQRIDGGVFAELVERYAERLLRDVIIRDDRGEPLPGLVILRSHDILPDGLHPFEKLRRARVNYEVRYALARPPRNLTLQQLMFTDGFSHASALALAIRGPDGESTTVQLTNRGNTETLDIEWPTRAPPPAVATTSAPAPPAGTIRVPLSERFKTVQTRVTIDKREVRVEVCIPLLLFETWQPIARRDRDFLTPAEQTAATPALERFFATRNTLRINGPTLVLPRVRVRFFAPNDEFGDLPEDRLYRLSAFTARVYVEMLYTPLTAPREVALTWDLFNNAVLDARATVVSEGGETQHDLTTYAPQLCWPRRAAAAQR